MGEKRLPLFNEMVPNGKFREKLLEEKEHVLYLPMRSKISQTTEIYLTGSCGQQISFLDGTVDVILHFRRQRPKKKFLHGVSSDANLEQYPENNAAEFKMQLPSQIHLTEDWEVAMTWVYVGKCARQ